MTTAFPAVFNAWSLRLCLATLRHVLLMDALFLAVVTRLAFIGSPNARRFWRQYRIGNGQAITFNTADVWQGDPSLAAVVGRAIQAQREAGRASGAVWVDQRHLANRDWRFALGSFQVNWEQASSGVTVALRGAYLWNPQQYRCTQPIHQAAEQLVAAGAQPFAYQGAPMELTNADLTVATRSRVVTHRLLM